MKRLFLLSLALPMAFAAHALDVPKFDPQQLSDDVRVLASDEYEGRAPGSAGEELTVKYLVKRMQEAGLVPGGELRDGKRSWVQTVPLVRNRIDGTPALSLKVGGKEQPLTQGEEIAVRAAQDGAKRVAIVDAPLVFLGYGVNAPERNWNDFKNVDLTDKIGVVLVNDPDFETGEGDFGGKTMTWYGRWAYKYEEGARQKALGILIVHEDEPAAYGWATVKNSNTNEMFDIVRDDPAAVHPHLAGCVQRDLAVDLMAAAGLDFDEQKKLAQTREFKPVQLDGVTFSADYSVKSELIQSKNVLGRIEGSEYPDETVIFSAHWDHLGVGAPDASGDTIYNGAIDNATGVAALLELARGIDKETPPNRSVVFFSPTGEEKGLLGSEYYVAKPLYPLEKTVAVLNVDAMDPGDLAGPITSPGEPKSDLYQLLIDTARRIGIDYVADPNPEAGYFFRSDHFPFAKHGVPALWFGSGLLTGDDSEGTAVGTDYITRRYHQPADEWQAQWSFKGMIKQLELLYRLNDALSNSRHWPAWSEESEFHATRAVSADQRQ